MVLASRSNVAIVWSLAGPVIGRPLGWNRARDRREASGQAPTLKTALTRISWVQVLVMKGPVPRRPACRWAVSRLAPIWKMALVKKIWTRLGAEAVLPGNGLVFRHSRRCRAVDRRLLARRWAGISRTAGEKTASRKNPWGLALWMKPLAGRRSACCQASHRGRTWKTA